MRYVAAYLLAIQGGNANPKKKDIEMILSSVGIESDTEKINLLIKQLSGKNITDVIAAGKEKLASVPSGASAAVSATTGAVGTVEVETKEVEKEEKKEESEESDDDMGFGLFD